MARNYNDASAPKCFSEAVRKVWVNAVAAGILSIIIYVSLGVVFKTVAPKYVGYQPVIENNEGIRVADGGPVYFTSDNAKFPKGDYDIIYGVSPALEIVSQILMAILFALMIYSVMWAFGDHQRNSVGIGNSVRDRFEGLKVGAVSSTLSICAWLFLLVSKIIYAIMVRIKLSEVLNCTGLETDEALRLISEKPNDYGIVNLIPLAILCVAICYLPYIPLIKAFVTIIGITDVGKDPALFDIFSNCEDISWVGVFALLIPLIFKLIVCHSAYELGYRQISIKEKIVYKNNKNI